MQICIGLGIVIVCVLLSYLLIRGYDNHYKSSRFNSCYTLKRIKHKIQQYPSASSIRYAKLKKNGGSHTKQEWENLKLKYNNRCLGCKQVTQLTKDHIIPIALGGTDNIDNIQPLCRYCNSIKNVKIIDYR